MTLPEQIILADHSTSLARAWREVFASLESVEVHESDFFAHDADAMVSPANSFGIMDGGIDVAIRRELGSTIEANVQAMIVEKHHGELPVGCAEVLSTGHHRWPFLVVAPTMRVPESIANTVNAYFGQPFEGLAFVRA